MEINEILNQQTQQISHLTTLITTLVANNGVAIPALTMLYCDTQNNKGGSKNGQIVANSKTLTEEELEFMRLEKNVRYRKKDKRFEWQKMIGGERFYEIDADYKELKRKIADANRQIKQMVKNSRFAVKFRKDCPTLAELCENYIKVNKQGIESANSYKGVYNNYLSRLTKPIDHYTKDEIKLFLDNDVTGSKKLAYFVLKNVFAEQAENGTIDRNIIATLKKPETESVDGRWFTIAEQKLIHKHIDESGMANEIEFFFMVGCRLSEAFRCVPNFERCSVYVKRTKKDGTSGYVQIPPTYNDKL